MDFKVNPRVRQHGLPLPYTRQKTLRLSTDSGLPAPKPGAELADNKDGISDTKTRAACRSFEAFMIAQMLRVMYEAGENAKGILPAGRAEKIFRSQQCDALGEVLASREPVGITRLLAEAVAHTKEVTSHED